MLAIPPGLSQVTHDGSLSGKGTTTSPLKQTGLEFTYPATGAEATAADGSSDFVLDFSAKGTMPSTAYNARVTCGGCASIYSFDVVLADNTTTTIHVKCSAKLLNTDVLQVSLKPRNA